MCNSTHVIPFRVQFRTGISLFEQIVYAAKKAMVSGQMRPGDPFPSVRALSKELKINPNTAHKIVAHLVSEGLLETRLGIGREEMLASIAEHWQRLSSKDPTSKDSQAAGKPAEEGRRER